MPRKENTRPSDYNATFPTRLRTIMRERNKTQQDVANAIGKSRQAVGYYTDGSSSPDWKTLAALSAYFNVSADWLLGLTEVSSLAPDINVAVLTTGLSEESAKTLNHLHQWGFDEFLKTIDALIFDAAHDNVGTVNKKGYRYRSILDLLYFFFTYSGSGSRNQVFANGCISQRSSTDHTISLNAIELNDRVIENAVLMEIQQALINLKESRFIKE